MVGGGGSDTCVADMSLAETDFRQTDFWPKLVFQLCFASVNCLFFLSIV